MTLAAARARTARPWRARPTFIEDDFNGAGAAAPSGAQGLVLTTRDLRRQPGRSRSRRGCASGLLVAPRLTAELRAKRGGTGGRAGALAPDFSAVPITRLILVLK